MNVSNTSAQMHPLQYMQQYITSRSDKIVVFLLWLKINILHICSNQIENLPMKVSNTFAQLHSLQYIHATMNYIKKCQNCSLSFMIRDHFCKHFLGFFRPIHPLNMQSISIMPYPSPILRKSLVITVLCNWKNFEKPQNDLKQAWKFSTSKLSPSISNI